MATVRGATAEFECANCRRLFTARVADRNRGWARFCGKSCKAQEQTRRTGRGRPDYRWEGCEAGTFGHKEETQL